MPDSENPLPTDHVFVLQLQESHGRPGVCRSGRVEHLATGEATRFTTTTELWEFVDGVLIAVIEGREFRQPHLRAGLPGRGPKTNEKRKEI